jgi:16S rRNA (guanine(966)-N(2))-methyltransferase RsmD
MRLKQVDASITRPISDRVKEALFNIIGSDIISSRMLDMFAGTGSVGIEALSRGASYVVFLDISSKAIEVIHSNLSATKFADIGEARQTDALEYLGQTARDKFDYIYIAPPQYRGMWVNAVEHVDNNLKWMSNDGWVIAQMHPAEYTEYDFQNLYMFDKRQYGNTLLVFYSVLNEVLDGC